MGSIRSFYELFKDAGYIGGTSATRNPLPKVIWETLSVLLGAFASDYDCWDDELRSQYRHLCNLLDTHETMTTEASK